MKEVNLNEWLRINTYLYFGYLPEKVSLNWVASVVVDESDRFIYSKEEASYVLDRCVDELLDRFYGGGNCVIPLSGGWDSRVLLGAALERFDRREIKTVTFGVPKQLDYEIGLKIAKRLNLEYLPVDLSKVEITWDALLSSASKAWTHVFDAFYNRHSVRQSLSSDTDVVLSGFMGDPLTGGHVYHNSLGVDDSIQHFLVNQVYEGKASMVSLDFDPRWGLPDLLSSDVIPYEQQLDIGVRQSRCIAPIVTPVSSFENWGGYMGTFNPVGAKVLAPFAHEFWARYWLNSPSCARQNQSLYLEMFRLKFPYLAAFPSKYSLGASTRLGVIGKKIHRRWLIAAGKFVPNLCCGYKAGLNYLDFSEAFRTRADFRCVLKQAIRVIREHDAAPWLDIDGLVNSHMKSENNYERALLNIVGLGVSLEKSSQ